MSPIPEKIAVAAGGRQLRMTMHDGRGYAITALVLRQACNCAECRRARLDGRFVDADPLVTITEADAIGQYAISIGFSDRHARGIYPWPYLIDLASGPATPGAPAEG
jgi:DUF971 family protein